MTLAVVQSASNNTEFSAATTLTCSLTSLPSVGNAVIAIFTTRGAAVVSSMADNQSGNTYAKVVAAASSAGSAGDAEIWWLSSVVGASGTFTVTVTASASEPLTLTLIEVSGLNAIDQTGSALYTGTNLASATVTGSAANTNATDLVVAAFGAGYQTGPTGTSNPCTTGYTSVAFLDGNSAPYGGVTQVSYKIVSAVETSSATWTQTAGDFNTYAVALASFKSASTVTQTIKAMAVKSGYAPSSVASATYVITV